MAGALEVEGAAVGMDVGDMTTIASNDKYILG